MNNKFKNIKSGLAIMLNKRTLAKQEKNLICGFKCLFKLFLLVTSRCIAGTLLIIGMGVLGLEVSAKAQNISGINTASIDNGNSIIISGSGFGTKNQATPLISSYDNNTSAYNWATGSLDSSWVYHNNGIDVTNSNPRNSNYQSSYKVTYPADGGYDDVGFNEGSTPDKIYVSWWMYRDTSTFSLSGDNSKFFVLYQATEGTCKVVINVNSNDGAGFCREYVCEDTWELSYGGVGNGYYNASKAAINRWSVNLNDAVPNFQVWEHWEVYLDYPSTNDGGDGVAILWKDGATVARSTSIRIAESHCLNNGRLFRIGQVSGSRSIPYNEYLDQVYIDSTVAHVFISNASNVTWPDYGSLHHSEIQVASAWSDNSITFTANQGSFPNGTAYLYVVNTNGDVSNGYPITIGSDGPDTTPPTRFNESPTGELSAGTTQTTISLSTNETAACKYGTLASVPYDSTTNTFSTTNSTSHFQAITGLSDGNSYNYYVRCQDTSTNANTDDYVIGFSVATQGSGDTGDDGGGDSSGGGCFIGTAAVGE